MLEIAMPKKRKKSKYKYAVIGKKKYYFYKIVWTDPCGDSGHADASEVKELKDENRSLKELVAELSLKNRDLKKNLNGED